jgi:hypothetical protein
MPVMYAALHGVNIPGGLWLDDASVRIALQRLPPSMRFLRSVGRPDSILIAASDTTTEEDVRLAVTGVIGRPCVTISTTLASRIVDRALTALRALDSPVVPPYRIVLDGAEWEWCLVLVSEALPCGKPDRSWLFEPRPYVVAITPLERRALLLRKRRVNDHGTRITLGDRLLVPWRKVLEANGVAVACLTSRTLNRVQEIATASVQFESPGVEG